MGLLQPLLHRIQPNQLQPPQLLILIVLHLHPQPQLLIQQVLQLSLPHQQQHSLPPQQLSLHPHPLQHSLPPQQLSLPHRAQLQVLQLIPLQVLQLTLQRAHQLIPQRALAAQLHCIAHILPSHQSAP